jgi:hypothetical protein
MKRYILRSGGWFNVPIACRVIYRRDYSGPMFRISYLGFRLIKITKS